MAADSNNAAATLRHQIAKYTLAFGIGIALALYAYQRVNDPAPGLQRAQEEAAVLACRDILEGYVRSDAALEIVDPLSPNRKVGKSYIYPAASGWEISGHYRRGDTDRWHPFLMSLDADGALRTLAVRDDSQRFTAAALNHPGFTARP